MYNQKVSIVLLTFNRSTLLKRAISHVLNQTYQNIELIIADDCSTDNTKEIIQAFNDDRIKHIKNKNNLGFFRNWQNAVQHINGIFVIPMISDDDYLSYNKFIEESVILLQDDNKLDIVCAKAATIYHGKKISISTSRNDYYQGRDIAKNFKKFQSDLTLSSLILRKKFLKYIIHPNFELNNNTVSNDQIIIFDIFLNAGKIKFIDKVVYHWIRDDEIETFSNSNCGNIYKSLKSYISFPNKLIPYLERENDFSDFNTMFNEYFLYSFEEISMNYYLSRDDIFSNILKDIKPNDIIYIYGKGEVGIKLKSFLEKNNIYIKNFIDDVQADNDVVKLSTLTNNKDNKTIIIASYKNSQIVSIMKKLISSKVNINNILTLIS